VDGLVYVIDDDAEVRTALSFLLRSMQAQSWPFSGGEDFLDALDTLKPGLVLLDMRMPDPDGLSVLRELAGRKLDWPVVAITGHGDIKLAVSAMQAGAFDFLEKPMEEEELSSVLERGFAELAQRRETRASIDDARSRINSLNGREQSVLKGIMMGQSNKVIASALGLSVRTVEMHRNNLVRKLGVKNAAAAVTVAAEAGFVPE
jgi:FixJ family two-component response regulator